jgi:hypothetical protein
MWRSTPVLRSAACLLLLALSAPVTSDEVVVVRMGARVESIAEQRILDATAAIAEKPGRRVRLVDLRGPEAGLVEIRGRQLAQALALRPAVVVLSLGPADLCGATSLRTFARELHVVTDLLRLNTRRAAVSTREACAAAGPGAGLRLRLEAFNWTIVQSAIRNNVLLLDVRADRDRAPGSSDPLLVAELEEALVRGGSGPVAPPPRAAAPRRREAM